MTEERHLYDPAAEEPLPEGEEAPPPYVRTMSIVRWVILGAISVFALVMVLGYFGASPWAAETKTATQYHCPMHPTYVSNQSGECPICGMNLVPIDVADKVADSTHSQRQTAQAATDAEGKPAAKPGQYTCPMDPEVISDTPGKCPKCGMDLEKVPEHDMGKMSTQNDLAVPGVVPVTIEPERLQLIGVRTSRVERRPLGDELRLTGYVTFDEGKESNIQSRVSGWIKKLYVNQTGQTVRAGERLYSIYSQELSQAQQDLLVASRSSKIIIDDSDLAYMRKQILEAARRKLQLLGMSDEEISSIESSNFLSEELTLRSPVSGTVVEKNVVAGQFVSPDQNLFKVADLNKIWVLADVYEQDFTQIKIGQKASMTLTSAPGDPIEGVLAFIYPTISSETRTAKVRLEFSNQSSRLLPGMFAEVRVATSNGDVLAIPTEAVMDGGNLKYAFVVHNRTHFEPHLVTIGRSSDEWSEVISGVAEGDEVVTSANFLIDSESRLKAAVSGLSTKVPGDHSGHDH